MDRPTDNTEDKLLSLIKIIYVPFVIAAVYFAKTIFVDLPLVYFILGGVALIVIGEYAIHKLPPKIVAYIFFGGLTTVVAQVSFNAVNWLISGSFEGLGGFWWFLPHTISWVLAVLFAFVTNRYFVFEGRSGQFWAELKRFVMARLGSGIFVEVLGMFVLVNLIGLAQSWSKLLTSVIVVIVNYIVSKFFVFKNPETTHREGSGHT